MSRGLSCAGCGELHARPPDRLCSAAAPSRLRWAGRAGAAAVCCARLHCTAQTMC